MSQLRSTKQVICPPGVICLPPFDFDMKVTGNNPDHATSSGTDVVIGHGSYSVDETVPTLLSGQTLFTTKSAERNGTS